MSSDWRIQQIHTSDVDELSMSVVGWTQRYTKLEPGRFDGAITIASGEGLQVFRERTRGVILEEGETDGQTLGLGIPVQASGSAYSFGTRLAAEREVMGFFAPRRLNLRTPENFDLLVVSVGKEMFQRFEQQRLVLPQAEWTAGRTGRLPEWLRQEIVDGSLVLTDPHTDARRLLRARQALLDCLAEALVGFESAPLRGKGLLCKQTVELALARVREWMHGRACTPLNVAALCTELGIPRRTLQYAFEQALGITPLQYLKSVRLAGARRTLKAGAASVLEACLEWGFDHPSAFARDYQAMFGELPSHTLLRARTPARFEVPLPLAV